MRNEKTLAPEQCLALPAADVATRCPGMGGRLLAVGNVALRHRRALRAQARHPVVRRGRRPLALPSRRRARPRAAHARAVAIRRPTSPPASCCARSTTAPSLRVGDELGALFAGAERRRTCVEQPTHGCAVAGGAAQGERAGRHAARQAAAVARRGCRRADAAVLGSDAAALRRARRRRLAGDDRDAAAVVAGAGRSRRPSSTCPTCAPTSGRRRRRASLDRRRGRRHAGRRARSLRQAEDDAEARCRRRRRAPTRSKLAHGASTSTARRCVAADRATVELTLTGDGNVLALTVDGARRGRRARLPGGDGEEAAAAPLRRRHVARDGARPQEVATSAAARRARRRRRWRGTASKPILSGTFVVVGAGDEHQLGRARVGGGELLPVLRLHVVVGGAVEHEERHGAEARRSCARLFHESSATKLRGRST